MQISLDSESLFFLFAFPALKIGNEKSEGRFTNIMIPRDSIAFSKQFFNVYVTISTS